METVSIDRFGRILIPKPVREQLSLEPNTNLEMRLIDGEISLRPVATGQILEQDGVFVWTGADFLQTSLVDLVNQSHEQ